MDTKYTRTTITLPEDLLYEIKKKALMEKRTITEVINESLSIGLGKNIPATKPIDINTLFGAWGKGESGLKFLKRIRYGKEEKAREKYLAKLWKRS